MTGDPQDIDVLILGGGINGAGLFRDLCEQGVHCVLVDKGDFGSGTSAAPSRLIHGGLKYLETGEFRLVAESTYERNLLLKNAAHLVRPLPTLIPIQTWTKGAWAAIRTLLGAKTAPRSRGALIVKIGLMLYDRFGARARMMPRHGMMLRSKARASIPALTDRIVAVGSYYDAVVTAPERLVLELVEDGLAADPRAAAFNWAELTGVDDGAVRVQDADGRPLAFRPKVTVNAAGPWIDAVNETLGARTAFIGGTKGSHILIAHDALVAQLAGRMIYYEADDGRICLVFPYHGRALVGSTDIPAQDPDDVRCDADEIAYFLDSLRRLLPGLDFTADQIVYAYSGIRPLPNSAGTAPGLISRDHSVPVLDPAPGRPFPVLSLVGGKWTTFRAFSQQVADDVLARLGHARKVHTHDLPIGGGRGFPVEPEARATWLRDASDATGLPLTRLAVLLDRYGTRAIAIARAEAEVTTRDAQDPSDAEIAWIARNERVVHLEDIVLRRTQIAVTGCLDAAGLDRIAAAAAAALGWSAERQTRELASVRATLADRHGVRLQRAAHT